MRFITCRLPDGVEDPAILSADGRQVWPLSWLGLSYETLSDAIPFLIPQVRAGLSLAIAGKPHPRPGAGCHLSGHQLHGPFGRG